MMLHKSPSKSGARLKYLAVPALVLALVGFASCTKDFDEKAAVTAASTQTTATAQEDPVYKVVEEMPTFNGGQEAMFAYFGDNFKYPKSAKEAGLEGKVIVSFIVDQVGKVTDAKVVKGFDPACDQAALEFVAAMPDWIPGEQGGKAVKVQMALPIQFKLD